MTKLFFPSLRIVGLVACVAGLATILLYSRAAARRDAIARAQAQVEGLLLREIEVEARRLGASTNDADAGRILRDRAHYEAGLFARALADGMDYLDPVIEARLLELLGAELAGSRPTSERLLARARELGLLAHDPIIRRRLINKRMLWEG
jgi:hypothetical protein